MNASKLYIDDTLQTKNPTKSTIFCLCYQQMTTFHRIQLQNNFILYCPCRVEQLRNVFREWVMFHEY